MNEAECLVKGLNILRKRGWSKGKGETSDGRVCAWVALQKACPSKKRGKLMPNVRVLWLSTADELFPDSDPLSDDDCLPWGHIATFNDWPTTTQEMVEQVFEKSIVRAGELL